MPPRWLSGAILVAWLASSVWLFRVEIWPQLESNAPPPFSIDIVDETQNSKVPINWRVQQPGENGQPANDVFTVMTSIQHQPRENDFTLRARLVPRGEGKLK